mgnify:CR=1 FL=1
MQTGSFFYKCIEVVGGSDLGGLIFIASIASVSRMRDVNRVIIIE